MPTSVGLQLLASSDNICTFNETLCISCGSCQDECQFAAIQQENGTSVVDV